MMLGSGELGKEVVIALKRMGCTVIACDAYEGAPAMQVADAFDIAYSVAIHVCEKGEHWQQAIRIIVILFLDYTTSGSFSFVSRLNPLGRQ